MTPDSLFLPSSEDLEEICPWFSQSIGRTFFPNQLLKELENSTRQHLALSHGDIVVAYALWEIIPPECSLLDIAVAPLFRYQGFGKKLMQAIFSECASKGCHLMFLEVRENNTKAISFYQSLGFEIGGRRKAYYQPENLDALVFQKALPK